jgi:hypothetical protein
MYHLAGNALTGFSLAPLRACMVIGLSVAVLTMLLSCLAGLAHLAGWSIGIGLIEILLLTQLAATFTCTGLLGEYVGRAYWEAKQRPHYVIQETCNVGPVSAGKESVGRSQLTLFETFPASGETRKRTCAQEHCHAA